MKSWQATTLIAVCIPLLTACSNPIGKVTVNHSPTTSPVASTAVLLKRTFKEGQVENYQQIVKTKTEGLPGKAGETKVTSDISRTYGQIDAKGVADVVMKTSNMRVFGAGDTEGKLQKDIVMNAKMGPHGMMQFAVDKNDKATQGMTDQAMPDGARLPDKPVNPGDTWTTTIPTMDLLPAGSTLKETFVGEEMFQGQPAWHIHYEGQFELSEKAGNGSKMKGSMDMIGEVFLDKTDCSVLTTASTSTTKISIPDGGKTTTLNQETVTALVRVK